MSENLCEGAHIFTEQGLIGFKSGPDSTPSKTSSISVHNLGLGYRPKTQ